MPAAPLTIKDPPLHSVARHGTGMLDPLLDAVTLSSILRMVSLAPRLAGDGLPEQHRRYFGALVGSVADLSPAEARAWLFEPNVAAWMARFWNVASGAAPPQRGLPRREWLARQVEASSFLMLRHLPSIWDHGGEPLSLSLGSPGALSPDGPGSQEASSPGRPVSRQTFSPGGLRWGLEVGRSDVSRSGVSRSDLGELDAGAGGPSELRLFPSPGGIGLEVDGAVACVIPAGALVPGATGEGIEVVDPRLIRIARRDFVLESLVEVFRDGADFPELTSRRMATETSSDLPLPILDRELRRAVALLSETWPEALAEARCLFRGLLPIQMPGESWNSASTGEVPFTLQLTFREDSWPYLLADSILHETAHTKLDLAMSLVPLLENDSQRIYRHPWRPDLRPMVGVLLGAHAFLAVTELYARGSRLRRADAGARAQFEQRRSEVALALCTLREHGRFTPEGETVFREMNAAFERLATV